MRRDGDVVGLGHGGDFAHLGDAAAADDVGHDVVCELLVEDGSEVPAGDESFADADRHGDLLFDEFEGVVVLGRDGFFEPSDVELAEGFADANRGGDVVASVEVDEQFDVGSDGVADGAGDLDTLSQTGRRDVVTVLQRRYIVEVPEGVHLEGGVTLGDRLESGLRISLRCPSPVEPAVGVEAEVFAEFSGDELVDGETVALAFDVPECDVDGGDEGGAEASVAGGVEFGEESGPDVVDSGRVFADQKLAEVRDCGVDHVRCDAALGLAEPGKAFVGLDGQEDPGVARAVADVGVYGGDFHGWVLWAGFPRARE